MNQLWQISSDYCPTFASYKEIKETSGRSERWNAPPAQSDSNCWSRLALRRWQEKLNNRYQPAQRAETSGRTVLPSFAGQQRRRTTQKSQRESGRGRERWSAGSRAVKVRTGRWLQHKDIIGSAQSQSWHAQVDTPTHTGRLTQTHTGLWDLCSYRGITGCAENHGHRRKEKILRFFIHQPGSRRDPAPRFLGRLLPFLWSFTFSAFFISTPTSIPCCFCCCRSNWSLPCHCFPFLLFLFMNINTNVLLLSCLLYTGMAARTHQNVFKIPSAPCNTKNRESRIERVCLF